jgi:bifunctional NMN adenylyltransferase/nudix hydrolase
MSKSKSDLIVYIGRFQPLHNGHVAVINQARTLAKNVLVLVGSSNQPRTFKNPFTYTERSHMIYQQFGYASNVHVSELPDFMYNELQWIVTVQDTVAKYANELQCDPDSIGIIGHMKDESSYYLKSFPRYKLIHANLHEVVHATNIRELFFDTSKSMRYLDGVVPPSTITIMDSFSRSDEYIQIIKEREFIENYKKQYAGLKYDPIFVTVDNVVIQAGCILLVKRKSEPGKGLWALPGGFLNAKTDKSIEDAALRELKEETKINVPPKVLRSSIKKTKVFDDIDRSSRGRTITHAFRIDLQSIDGKLDKIKAASDAADVQWIPINMITSDMMFEDHYHIIRYFVGQTAMGGR